MAYETGSGTFQTMLDNLAAFALANGWSARTPAAHQYWSILGKSRDTANPYITEIDYIAMAESSGGPNVLTGGIVSGTAGTPSNALADDGVLWSLNVASSDETRWTYDFGLGNEKSIVEVTVKFGSPSVAYRFFELQYSDDGSNWTTLKSFRPGVTSSGQTFVGLWTNDDWPLTPDGDNYLDFILETGLSTTGYTLAGGSFPIDDYSMLYMNIGRERISPIDWQGATVELPTLTIDEWHFFGVSSPTHFHVAFRVTYLGLPYWFHFSAGEIDKKGMTHNGVAYCTSSLMTALVKSVDTNGGTFTFHSTIEACGYFIGRLVTGLTSSLCYRLTQTGGNFPYPNDGIFPSQAGSHVNGDRVMPTLLPSIGARRENNQFVATTGRPPALGSEGWRYVPHPTTGFVTLGVLPFIVGNTTDPATADLRWLGEFPNVRTVRMDNLEPGAEITVGSDVWMCFPLLRKVSAADASWPNRVAQSGPAGIAYKKVVV